MEERVFSVLGAYDFFAKSLPGVAFLLGLLFLLPKSSLELLGVSITNSALGGILLLLSITLIGTLVGEAVHIFAINIERILGGLTGIAKRDIGKITELLFQPRVDAVSKDWIHQRYSGLQYIFIPNDSIWEKVWGGSIQPCSVLTVPGEDTEPEENLTPDENLKENLKKEFAVECDSPEDVFPLLKCYVRENGVEQSQRFLARSSFCRGMWVVLFSLTGLYIAAMQLSYDNLGFYAKPIFVEVLSDTGQVTFALLIGFLSVLFMLASGSYKRKYVEFLLSEQYLLSQGKLPAR